MLGGEPSLAWHEKCMQGPSLLPVVTATQIAGRARPGLASIYTHICRYATHHAQKDERLSVSRVGRPCTDLNHCRSLSTRDTSAMGALNTMQHKRVMSSKRFSGSCTAHQRWGACNQGP